MLLREFLPCHSFWTHYKKCMLSCGITKTKVYIPHVSIEYCGDKNKMRKGDYCIRNIDKLVNEGCINPKRANELKNWQKFREEHSEISELTEGACQPLMREKDPEVQARAIVKMGRAIKHKGGATAAQTARVVQNIEDGKDNRGRSLEISNDIEIEEPVIPEVDVDEDVEDNVETVVEGFVDPNDDEERGISDIPVMPEVEVTVESEEKEEEEEVIHPEFTAKVTKEFLSNAGHTDEVKPERIPCEEDKIALVEKFVRQMYEWGVGSEEIKRRIEKALIFASQS